MALAGCDRSATAPAPTGVRLLATSELSEAELRYGVAPEPDAATVYQPDVVIVRGGAAAIRSLSGNGFQWSIDPDAAGARDLAVGKVFFMTGMAVGRVLDLRRSGADLLVTVGPVELTELLQDAHLQLQDVDIDVEQLQQHAATEVWGNAEPMAALLPARTRWLPAMYAEEPAAPAPDASYKDLSAAMMNFTVMPFVEGGKLGMRINKAADGLKVAASAALTLSRPKIDADIYIKGGQLLKAVLALKGAAGLTWSFEAGTDVGRSANVRAFLDSPVDLYIPVAIVAGFPMAVTVRQTFQVQTALGVRNSTIAAAGDYAFQGAFEVGYVNGTWNASGPTAFTARHSLLDDTRGVSLAVTGIQLAHQLHLIAGVGAFGFATGPYINLTSSVGVTRASDIGMLPCKEATLVVGVGGGVGYFLPRSLVAGINRILAALNIQYRMATQGTIQPSPPVSLVKSTEHLPGCNTDAR